MRISHIKLARVNLQTGGITLTISAFHRHALYPASHNFKAYVPTNHLTYTRQAHSRAEGQRKNTRQRERLTRCEAVTTSVQYCSLYTVSMCTSPHTTGNYLRTSVEYMSQLRTFGTHFSMCKFIQVRILGTSRWHIYARIADKNHIQ